MIEAPAISTATPPVQCAWCRSWLTRPAAPGEAVSHGICPTCKASMVAGIRGFRRLIKPVREGAL